MRPVLRFAIILPYTPGSEVCITLERLAVTSANSAQTLLGPEPCRGQQVLYHCENCSRRLPMAMSEPSESASHPPVHYPLPYLSVQLPSSHHGSTLLLLLSLPTLT